jgi:Domain of unknown function (DUF4037)/Nucleotidyltransferase domain
MVELGAEQLATIARRIVAVDGVVAVLLGGSRARGEQTPESDTDLGLYYRPPLDVPALTEAARLLAGPDAAVTEPGDWGPWVDGGGWLTIGGAAVDWLYRDMDRVRAAWSDAQLGKFTFHAQTGHPLGVPDFAYAGEVARGVVLADPTGELTELQNATRNYPPQLGTALIGQCLWEAEFLLAIAGKAVSRNDATYVAGCLFRVCSLCAHALHGHAGRWLINEKGAIAAAALLPGSPTDFAGRAHSILGVLGRTPAALAATISDAAGLVAQIRAACGN